MIKKSAVITGAADGLGWALAKRLLQDGWQVLLVDKDEPLLHKRVLEMEPSYADICICPIDLLEPGAVNHIQSTVSHTLGSIDLLINNAGITHRSLVDITEPLVFNRIMALDFQSPVELTLALKPFFKENGHDHPSGIINIGSMAGWMPVVGRAGYCAAKAALSQFFETYRAEQLPTDPHILMVYPSFLATNIEKNALGHDGGNAIHKRTSVGAIASAESMAEQIIKAYDQKKARLFPDRFTLLSAMLYRIWPSLFIHLMKSKFSDELSHGRSHTKQASGVNND